MNVHVDSSEDAEINLLKAGEVTALAVQAITDFTHKFLQEDENNEDVFASVDEDEKGLEQNKLLILSPLTT